MTNLLLEVARFAATAALSGLWQGFALILMVALALGLLPRLNAGARFIVWAMTFAAVALLPFLHTPAHQPAAPSALPSPLSLGIGWAVTIASLWAFAVVVRLAQLLNQALRLRRIWRSATQVIPHAALEGLLATASRQPRLCTSRDVDTPSVIGFISPRLLIPDWLYPTLTEQELSQIVLHECEHLRRRDDWINLLQKLALALFPLNPALLFADRRLGLERELACDAGVIAATDAPFDYATCLTHLAEQRIGRRSPLALALSAWNRQSELGQRVHRLLRPIRTVSPAQRRLSLAVLSLALVAAVATISHTPTLISFVGPTIPTIAAASSPGISDNAVRSLPVVYRQPILPRNKSSLSPVARPSMIKAYVPALTNRHRNDLHATAARNTLSLPQLLLTTSKTSRAPRAIHATWTDFSPTYAAVPFADGWLIIQL